MKGFSRPQLKKLVGKLDRAHVQTRAVDGRKRDYIEGWFAISEANAIFGFAGWDRQMMAFERVFEAREGRQSLCAYFARVRITVRAGEEVILREGTGFGEARGYDRAETHERALKAAETDATKRALMTFGNRFGLGLYDKDQNGVTALPSSTNGAHDATSPTYRASGAMAAASSDGYVLHDETDDVLADSLSAEGFCSGLRQLIEAAKTEPILETLRGNNQAMLVRLRTQAPQLCSAQGKHFADILEDLLEKKSKVLQGQGDGFRRAPPPADGRARTARAGVATPSAQVRPPSANGPSEQGRRPPSSGTDHLSVAGQKHDEKSLRSTRTSALPPAARTLQSKTNRPGAGPPARLPDNSPPKTDGRAPNPQGPDDSPLSVAEQGQEHGRAPHPSGTQSRIGQGAAIDKSRLLVATTKRVRSKAHLAFVASQYCLVCGGSPCHAHHLTFAQSRGLSLKVSDEFTVPLCVIHHNALHVHGDERAFWRQHRIDPLGTAQALWCASRDKTTKGDGGGTS